MSTYEEWLTVYPDITDPNFSGKIASMAEFAELAGSPTEEPVKNGKLYPHQKLFRRLFDEYSRALVIDAPGTGKTCLFVALAELYRRRYLVESSELPSFLNPPKYNRVYVVTRGDIIGENFENELVCRCTNGVYEVPEGAPLTVSQKWGVIRKQIKEYYTRYTNVPFANLINGMSDAKLRDYFNGSIIVIDEGHNIIPTDKAVNSKLGGVASEDKQRMLYVYEQFKRLSHVITRGKVIILTATPTRYNPIHEISQLINILRPADSQMPIDPDMTMEEFGHWVNGYITYVRELDNGVDLVFKGTPIEDSSTVVDAVEMSEFQSDIYSDAYERYGAKSFYVKVREAGNIVYPDGSYGKEGEEQYIKKVGDSKWAFSDEMIDDIEETKQVMGNDFIKKYSAKFHRVAKLTLKYYKQGKKGFVYQEFKKSGAIPLGLFLEELGAERFYSKESAFVNTGDTKSRNICGTSSDISDRKIKIKKAFRYGLLIPDNSTKINSTMIELFNSPENRYGEYIAVLIFSPHGREGISIFDIQWTAQIPTWLWPPAKQSIYRGRRLTSQIRLLNDEREQAILEGRDPSTVRLNLNVHMLAAIPLDENIPPVDIIMYTDSETTAKITAPYMTKMRSKAIDCFINYKRNVLPGDEELNGSPICDYGSCVYECDSEPPLPPDEWDYSGLLRKYTGEYRSVILTYLRNLARRRIINPLDATINDLTQKGIKRQVVLIELYKISREYELFINRMGQSVYLHISGGYLVFSTDFPSPATISEAQRLRQLTYYQYLSSFPWLKQDSLENIINQTNGIEIDFSQLTVEEAFKLLEESPDRTKVLEAAIEDVYSGSDSPSAKAIWDYYDLKIFVFEEPLDEIRDMIRQKRKSKTAKPAPLPPEPSSDAVPQTVIIHTLQSTLKTNLTRYNYAVISKKPPNLRIYYPETKKWRDANWIEVSIYDEYISAEIDNREEQFGDIYGLVIIDDPVNEFRIVNKQTWNAIDSRERSRGKVCRSWNFFELLPILYTTGFIKNMIPNPEIDDDMAQDIVDEYSDNEIWNNAKTQKDIRRIAQLIMYNKERKYQIVSICPAFREYLDTIGKLARR